MADRDDFWDDAVRSLDNATITSTEESQDPAVSRSKNIAQDKKKQLMLVFLMGTHPRVGSNSDIQILSLGHCPDRSTDPLNIICGLLLKADDQAVYLKDLEKYPSKINDYVFEKRIGKGTYGKVYLGVHRRTGYEVAIKALNKKKIAAQKMTEKVARETAILRKLSGGGEGHPHVVRLYDVLETAKKYYMVMDLCTGGDFFDFLSYRGSVTEDEARALFLQMLSGVEYCHQHGVCHRDLKPENILIDSECNIKIADFSLANTAGIGGSVQGQPEYLETSCGSPNYAAPEIITGKAYNGFQVDVWSLGVILYSLVCGCLPFDDESPIRLFKAIKAGDYPPPPPHVSDACRSLLQSMLTTDPDRRVTVRRIRAHAWCQSETFACSRTLFAYAPFAPADGEDSDSASTDGTDSDEELKLHGPGSPERPVSIRRKSSGLAGPGDAAGGGDTLEIYYRSHFARTFLNYTVDGTNWTPLPGEPMGRSTDPRFPSPPWQYLAVRRERWGTGGIRFAFNDGKGTWENRGGPQNNYSVPRPGAYSIDQDGQLPQPI